MLDITAGFTAETGIDVLVNTVAGYQVSSGIDDYLGGSPEDVLMWITGHQMRQAAAKGLLEPLDDVWAQVGSRFSQALKEASTGDDGRIYAIPYCHGPWAVFYRRSLFASHGYSIPTTWTEYLALAARMKRDGITPLALGDLEGWAGLGLFDILNLRQNGYRFHARPDRGSSALDGSTGPRRVRPPAGAPFDRGAQSWRSELGRCRDRPRRAAGRDGVHGFLRDGSGPERTSCPTWACSRFLPSRPSSMRSMPSRIRPTRSSCRETPRRGRPTRIVRGPSSSTSPRHRSSASWRRSRAGLPAFPAVELAAADRTPLQEEGLRLVAAAQHSTQFLDRDASVPSAVAFQDMLHAFVITPDQPIDPLLAKVQATWDPSS